MAAYRKKYASLENDEPVTTAPNTADARLPDRVEDPKPIIEPAPAENKVEAAAAEAIKQRLEETLRANQSAPQPQQPPPPQADDPDEQARLDEFRHQLEHVIAPLPEEAKPWFRMHPEYLFDGVKSAAANHFHNVAVRETGEHFTPRYFESLERNLGLRQPEPPPQRQAPLARPAGPSVGYAAPPTREAPSLSTGHIPSDGRVRLTKEEVNIAKGSGISLEEYARQKLKAQRLKQYEGYGDAG